MFISRLKYLLKRFFQALKNENIIVIFKKICNTILYSNKIDLDKLNVNENLGLDDLFLKFGTDKGSLDGKKTYTFLNSTKDGTKKFKNYYDWINRENPRSFDYQLGHNFTPLYEKYLGSLKKKPLKILEIGSANGHAVASFFYYFPNSKIYTIDIKKSYFFFYKSKRINFHCLDCMNNDAVNKFIIKNGKFDIIIDDSDHTHPTFTNNIKNFYPALNCGGIYILEDFKYADQELTLIKKHNENSGRKIMSNFTITMDEIFNFIKNKKMFKHEILKEDNLKYIFDTVDKVEIHYGEHPLSSMGLLFKKF